MTPLSESEAKEWGIMSADITTLKNWRTTTDKQLATLARQQDSLRADVREVKKHDIEDLKKDLRGIMKILKGVAIVAAVNLLCNITSGGGTAWTNISHVLRIVGLF